MTWLSGIIGQFNPAAGAALGMTGAALGGNGGAFGQALMSIIPQPFGDFDPSDPGLAPGTPGYSLGGGVVPGEGGQHLPRGARPGVPVQPGPHGTTIQDNRIQIAPGGSINTPTHELAAQFDAPKAQMARRQFAPIGRTH